MKLNEVDKDIYEAKNKTDRAFIEFLLEYQIDIDTDINKCYLEPNTDKKSPFDNQKKRMSIMIQSKSFPTGYRLFTKGGEENSLLNCTQYINYNFSK